MTLKKISEKLRKKHTESEIVRMIKNREIPEIEKRYTTQKNYPNGVYVHGDDGGVMFGFMFGEVTA